LQRLVSAISNLGRFLLLQKKYSEAEPLLRECRKLAESYPDTWSRFRNQSNLGASLAGQGKYTEAESHLLSGYQGLKEMQSTDPPGFEEEITERNEQITEAGQRIIDLYTAWGKPKEAAKWREALDSHTSAEKRIDAR
jgi:eukaryotic-like serine/threonine-protein kinase